MKLLQAAVALAVHVIVSLLILFFFFFFQRINTTYEPRNGILLSYMRANKEMFCAPLSAHYSCNEQSTLPACVAPWLGYNDARFCENAKRTMKNKHSISRAVRGTGVRESGSAGVSTTFTFCDANIR